MERPLIWTAVSYLCGLVLGEALTYCPLTVTGMLLIGSGAAYALRGRSACRSGSLRPLFLIVGFVLFGMVRLQIAGRIPPDDLASFATRALVRLVGIVDEPLQHGPESAIVILQARSITLNGQERPANGKLRLVVSDFIPDLQYGDLVSAELKLRPVSGLRNPGGFDYAAFLQREGIRASAVIHRPEAITRLAAGGFAPLRRIYIWRERIRRLLEESLSPASSAILQAMLIGETGALSPEIREAFMISGTTHLLSISGSHLALVAFVVFRLSGWTFRRMPASWLLYSSRRLTATRLSVLITCVPVVFYALLAGAQVATVRSLLMILVYLAAVWLQRADDPLNALAVAALVILIWDPRAIFSISFQLSYTAVLAMALAGERRSGYPDVGGRLGQEAVEDPSWMDVMFGKARLYFLMTVTAGASTLPLTAYYFNQIGWVGFLSNPVVVPFVGMVIVPLGLACSVGAIFFGSATMPLAGLNDWLGSGLFSMVEWFARFPASELHVPSPPIPVVGALYIAGLMVLISRRLGVRRWTVIGLCLLITWLWIGRFLTSHHDGRLRVTFLDVGQGDAAWIEMPDGETMLIDGGGAYGNFDLGRLAVAPYLWNTGHWKIGYLVASHPQLDHMGGLGYIAKKFRIGEVWTNGQEKGAIFYDRFQKVVLEKAIPEKRITGDGRSLRRSRLTISVLHPKAFDPSASDNNQSLVIRIEYGREAVLFTGDIERSAERELLRWGDRLRATVLKVPHHGSRTSIDPDFLSRVAPAVAVISVGGNNPYRHPSAETLAAYDARTARVYRTDRDGAVIFETDGERRTVRTYQDIVVRPVSWRRGMAAVEASNLKKLFDRCGFGPD
ncbi:MAG: DNA internalization-related competence protein ComEC/Rec2 [Nitrospirae bacterium]|nr:DNA internalization-related competence protein ComEC/Rec2 [Nitrospirota bacterium]